MRQVGHAAVVVENRDHEMANLNDACEELRTRIVKYEFATGRYAAFRAGR